MAKNERTCFETMSIEERKKYFAEYYTNHPHLTEATNHLLNRIIESISEEEPSIIYVIGATGSGKTTMLKKVANVFSEYAAVQLGYTSAYIPIVEVEAIAPDDGSFDFRDHYRRTLIELHEPLIHHKIDCLSQDTWRDIGRVNINPSSKKSDFRLAVQNAFINRKVMVYVIDEAHHIGAVSSGRRLENHIEALKSLVNTSGVTLVLSGIHKLLDIYGLNGQLMRRSQKVILHRYDINKEGDKENFQAVLYEFIERLPFLEKGDLLDDWEFFYERSIGCIGILKIWMTRTVNYVLRSGENSIYLAP